MQETKKKNSKILLSLMMAVAIIISFVAGYFVKVFTTDKTTRLVSELLKVMQSQSTVLDADITSDEIAKQVVDKLLEYDKYAEYYTAEEYKTILAEGKGNYAEIGIVLYSNMPVVFRATGNSPAQKAGVIQGDKVLAVKLEGQTEWQEITSSSQFNEIVKKAPMDKNISVKILRGEDEKIFEIKKMQYTASYLTYVDSSTQYYFEGQSNNLFGKRNDEGRNESLDEKTAIITLEQFEGEASSQFASALNFMFSQGREKLILDLRDNGGGYMNILIEVASHLIYNEGKDNTEIAYAKGKSSSQSFIAKRNNFNSKLKDLVVIANHNTASASECLIGALLHYKDCNFTNDRLVLTKNPSREDYSTYGKGIMQTTYLISTGGAFKLTTANIYWPNRTTCIHEEGIKQTNKKNQVLDKDAIARGIEILSGV